MGLESKSEQEREREGGRREREGGGEREGGREREGVCFSDTPNCKPSLPFSLTSSLSLSLSVSLSAVHKDRVGMVVVECTSPQFNPPHISHTDHKP